ncbi:hypothetical protein [Thalassomonas actiniarum]|uniref:Uncharacterized protein n=1 Tax=Thalassomonas actiniarum TaxID=485447 RepID=A0AAF0C1N1_9GAMM|nr:hypothetical protein [Thalassomonas actiniarum]WDD99186.1 hypothetical protein SG35_000405 [Thalassomonas actiniarum]
MRELKVSEANDVNGGLLPVYAAVVALEYAAGGATLSVMAYKAYKNFTA